MSKSRPKRSRYQNPVQISGVGLVVLTGVVGLALAFAVAHFKNLFHSKEGQKLALRGEIEDLRRQTAMLANEYLKESSAERVRARVAGSASRLREIPHGAVVRVDAPLPAPAGAAVTMR